MTETPATISPNPTTERAQPGTVVGGRYTLRASIGHGGMGTVWRGTDTQLGRDVAVKEVVPPPGIAPDDRDAMYERMLREARAAASVSHPGIVQVYDVVTEGDRPWVVMELLDARSLSDMILEDGPLAPRAVAKIGVAMLGALEMAHAAGVLHRDVKPANVLVCTDGRCVLTDFGVARMPTDQQLTTPGMVLGSPHFISPERAMGAKFGPPSDLFSLGVTLYIAVEGQPPFDKGEPIATMHSVVEDEPLVPQRAGPLTDILYGLLEKDPERRWGATAARNALRELLAGPLASRTPLFPTDPYAVVRTQQLPLPQPATGTGGHGRDKIGGRALLSPGEIPGDRAGNGQPPGGYQDEPDRTTVVQPAASGANGAGTTATTATISPTNPTSPARPTHAAAPGGGSGLSRVAGPVTRAGGQAWAALRRSPQSVQLAVAAGLVAVVLLGVMSIWAFAALTGDSDGGPGAQAAPAPTADADNEPPFEVQEYSGRGIVVNLPATWQQGADDPGLLYVDFVDPEDASAQVRLLFEDWSSDAHRLVEVAEENLQNNEVCAGTYQRIGITDIEVAGMAGAQLEYTCGEGADQRHAKWATVVSDGTAYSFRLTTKESEFAEHEHIFQELVSTFRLA